MSSAAAPPAPSIAGFCLARACVRAAGVGEDPYLEGACAHDGAHIRAPSGSDPGALAAGRLTVQDWPESHHAVGVRS
jgi:hypothetical protein